MFRVTSLAALALLAAAPLSSALAASLSKTVPAGRASQIDAYSGWNLEDCSFQTISFTTTSQPAHGRITTRIGHGRITNANTGSAGKCYGKPTKVLQLWYTPQRGYHGSDTVSVTAGGTAYYYSITVQ